MTRAARKLRPASLQEQLIAWYRSAKRDLPWRSTRDPYAIWVSEIMLQQTRTGTVIPYFLRFLRDFPTVQALAAAPEDRVLERWAGLGYYSRARALQRAARAIVAQGGQFPRDAAALEELPGIGRYTAGAIASIAFDQPAPLLDGNVARVFARLYALDDAIDLPATRARLWALAATLVDPAHPSDWNQGLMELGALVCTVKSPSCETCPVTEHCLARAAGRQHELPRRSPKRAPRALTWVALALTRGDAIVLARRHPRGLFGGLWELPSTEPAAGESPDAAAGRLAASLGLRLGSTGAPRRAGEIAHTLTHRQLALIGYRAALPRAAAPRLPPDHAWYDQLALVPAPARARHGMSTATRRLLTALDLHLE